MAKNPRLIDMSGQRIGRWTVGTQAGNTKGGGALWTCRCDCGTVALVTGGDLRFGKSTECGCTSKLILGNSTRTHSRTGTRIYRIWQNMRKRCSNPNTPGFQNYGGRGITFCAEWADYPTFERWALGSGYSDELSIERVDVNGNYEPANCTWADAATQSANRRFVAKDENGVLWWHKARDNGITRAAYAQRVFAGWPFEQAVTWPMAKKRVKRERNELGQFF